MEGWRTKVQAVVEYLERRIAQGELQHGRTLPSERALARQLGASRPTVREALQRLSSRGLVVVHGGHSTWAREEGDAATVHAVPNMLSGADGKLLPRGRKLLQGLFELEVLMTLEALQRCFADGSPEGLRKLVERCLELRWSARREDGPYTLLRVHYDVLSAAICATDSISLLLLFNSLESALVEALPHLSPVILPEPLAQLADVVIELVQRRDAPGVHTTLAPLLRAEAARRLAELVPASSSTEDGLRPAG